MDSQSVSSETGSSRTLVSEVVRLPLVTWAALKVLATHEALCGRVQVYGKLAGVALSSATKVADTARTFSLVNSTVDKVDYWGLQAFDKLKKTCPIIGAPTDQVVEKASDVLLSIKCGSKRVASLTVVQATCWATEAVLGTAERTCHNLKISDNGVWPRVIHTSLPTACLLTINSALTNTSVHLGKSRQALEVWRGSGTDITGEHFRIMRGKKSSGWWWWAWMSRRHSTWAHSSSPALRQSNPAMEREPDESCENEAVAASMLLKDLKNYNSDQDPDYQPSNVSTTDSMEYMSGNDSSLDNTEDKMESENIEGAQPQSPVVIIVTHYEDQNDAAVGSLSTRENLVETTQNQEGPVACTSDKPDPLETTQNHEGPVACTGNSQDPLETTQNSQEGPVACTSDKPDPFDAQNPQEGPVVCTSDKPDPLETTQNPQDCPVVPVITRTETKGHTRI